jgi:uncharacterized protein YggU (UPF0235/DUF167 family)
VRTNAQAHLLLHVVPGARLTAFAGRHGDAWKLRVSAPPEDGRANREILRFIASKAGLGANNIRLAQGAGSRRKRLVIRGLEPGELLRRLGLADEPPPAA